MKQGRINERNIGNWTLDSEPKQRKLKIQNIVSELSEIQEKALISLTLIKDILKSYNSNYYSFVRFDLSNKLLEQWFNNGIIEKGTQKSKCDFMPDKEICIVKKPKDLELVKGLLIHFYFNQNC